MQQESRRGQGLWQDWVNMVLGIWLFIAPFFAIGLGSEAAVWNSYIMGAAIFIIALAAVSRPQKWKEWTNLILGIWLILAPFVLGFTEYAGAMWNQIIVGILVGADALWAMQTPVHKVAPQQHR